jgi:hypothetical protein
MVRRVRRLTLRLMSDELTSKGNDSSDPP